MYTIQALSVVNQGEQKNKKAKLKNEYRGLEFLVNYRLTRPNQNFLFNKEEISI